MKERRSKEEEEEGRRPEKKRGEGLVPANGLFTPRFASVSSRHPSLCLSFFFPTSQPAAPSLQANLANLPSQPRKPTTLVWLPRDPHIHALHSPPPCSDGCTDPTLPNLLPTQACNPLESTNPLLCPSKDRCRGYHAPATFHVQGCSSWNRDQRPHCRPWTMTINIHQCR